MLLLMLVSVRFFDLRAVQSLFSGANDFTWYMVILAFMYMRFMGFERRMGGRRELRPLFWLWTGFFVSFIGAYVFYGQGLMNSLIVTRDMFLYLTYPLLLAIRPSFTELKRAFYLFGVIYFFAVMIVTFIAPDLVVIPDFVDFIQEGDLVHGLDGLANVLIAFGFALNDFRVTRKRKYLLLAGFLFINIFLIQNRTFLVASIMIFMSLFLFDQSRKRRLYSLTLIIIFGSLLVVVGLRHILGLVSQTFDELSNPDYNRVKAFLYFVSSPNGWLGNIIGSGFISGRVHPLIANLRKDGIFNSDLGLIGMWNQFGILTVSVIVIYVIKGLQKDHSFMVKTTALGMLCCFLTIGYFFSAPNILWLSVYFYLLFCDDEYAAARKDEREAVSRKLIQRYRSISRE